MPLFTFAMFRDKVHALPAFHVSAVEFYFYSEQEYTPSFPLSMDIFQAAVILRCSNEGIVRQKGLGRVPLHHLLALLSYSALESLMRCLIHMQDDVDGKAPLNTIETMCGGKTIMITLPDEPGVSSTFKSRTVTLVRGVVGFLQIGRSQLI